MTFQHARVYIYNIDARRCPAATFLLRGCQEVVGMCCSSIFLLSMKPCFTTYNFFFGRLIPVPGRLFSCFLVSIYERGAGIGRTNFSRSLLIYSYGRYESCRRFPGGGTLSSRSVRRSGRAQRNLAPALKILRARSVVSAVNRSACSIASASVIGPEGSTAMPSMPRL